MISLVSFTRIEKVMLLLALPVLVISYAKIPLGGLFHTLLFILLSLFYFPVSAAFLPDHVKQGTIWHKIYHLGALVLWSAYMIGIVLAKYDLVDSSSPYSWDSRYHAFMLIRAPLSAFILIRSIVMLSKKEKRSGAWYYGGVLGRTFGFGVLFGVVAGLEGF